LTTFSSLSLVTHTTGMTQLKVMHVHPTLPNTVTFLVLSCADFVLYRNF